MTLRVAHRFAHEAVSAPCARCLLVVVLPAGSWHAAEHGDPGMAVCDRCAAEHDPDGWRTVVAFRRMAAAGPTIGRAA